MAGPDLVLSQQVGKECREWEILLRASFAWRQNASVSPFFFRLKTLRAPGISVIENQELGQPYCPNLEKKTAETVNLYLEGCCRLRFTCAV
jgi:hypothetical protein